MKDAVGLSYFSQAEIKLMPTFALSKKNTWAVSYARVTSIGKSMRAGSIPVTTQVV